MPHFIEVTLSSSGKKVLINTNWIFAVEPNSDQFGKCEVKISMPGYRNEIYQVYRTSETYDEISAMIRK